MLQDTIIRAQIDHVLETVEILGLPNHYHGKVRDSYDLTDGTRIIIASDRLSAFDRNIVAIPFKGQVLTQLARFWFDETEAVCRNHVIEYPDPNVLLGKRLRILPVEIIVRDYLTGSTGTSIWPMYEAGSRTIYGIDFPRGLRKNQKLPHTIITPTTKAYGGAHDEPLTVRDIIERRMLTSQQWEEVASKALSLFARGKEIAQKVGLILVDTKYEFGLDEENNIILADEIHTPDSSRYWESSSYEARFASGEPPESFDKDYIRQWVRQVCDPYRQDIPAIPKEIIIETSKIYIRVFERITRKEFEMTSEPIQAIDRIKKNLGRFMSASGPSKLKCA